MASTAALDKSSPSVNSCEDNPDKYCDCNTKEAETSSSAAYCDSGGGTAGGKIRRLHGQRKHHRPEKNYIRSTDRRSACSELHNFVSSIDRLMSATSSSQSPSGQPIRSSAGTYNPAGRHWQPARSRITSGAPAVDHSNELTETVLQGATVSCFVIGGEKRLCLPEVMSTVLQHVPLIDIERACNRLKIHNQLCSPNQAYALQMNKVLPSATATCGLITQANAERLCHYLLHTKRYFGKACLGGNEGQRNDSTNGAAAHQSFCTPVCTTSNDKDTMKTAIPVVHNCSGCVQGTAFVCLYKSPNAACIQCDQCALLFSPQDFVCHGHREGQYETADAGPHVCHWGLDSNKWRLYINVNKGALSKLERTSRQDGKVAKKAGDQSFLDKLTIKSWEKQLSEMKRMFSEATRRPCVPHAYDQSLRESGVKAQSDQCQPPFTVPNLLLVQPHAKFSRANTFRDQVPSYSSIAATTMALTNPGAVAMEIGFDSLIRVARQMSSGEESAQNAIVDEIVKLRLICQHSTSFLFQTNSLLSHSVDQLARENFALKRDYEQLAGICASKADGDSAQKQCSCFKPTRRKVAVSDSAEQTTSRTATGSDCID